ncbi:hypothetical protein VSX64_14835 [Aurantimonas sp. C2-6-R+9]|uniref:hypothetical protein n=1 Tax=unclassified Aurantimonas TaxID=2638230 RepID=UPI002E1809BF|nr:MULTISPECIES: hypothetical protein [unclassified Aurantimonas]MEC5292354.1 hypothetical protein [Aurantimonas sp. C2-3-R2]MEC5382144.1 hypothetical protein [Aurantimonas sp. C2-6-R+9]MEC5413417.1 hypothetical protein [Aurantimonas sp. C2-4-R8]
MTNVLSFELEKTADWRDRKTKRHPEDVRNGSAAQKLRELASQKADNDLADRYQNFLNDLQPDQVSEIHSEFLGAIGFRWNPSDVDEVLKDLTFGFEEAAKEPLV